MNITQEFTKENLEDYVYFIESPSQEWLIKNTSEFYQYDLTKDPMKAEYFYNKDNAEEFLKACQADGECLDYKITEHLFISAN